MSGMEQVQRLSKMNLIDELSLLNLLSQQIPNPHAFRGFWSCQSTPHRDKGLKLFLNPYKFYQSLSEIITQRYSEPIRTDSAWHRFNSNMEGILSGISSRRTRSTIFWNKGNFTRKVQTKQFPHLSRASLKKPSGSMHRTFTLN